MYTYIACNSPYSGEASDAVHVRFAVIIVNAGATVTSRYQTRQHCDSSTLACIILVIDTNKENKHIIHDIILVTCSVVSQ